MLRALRVPAENTRGAAYMDQALAAIHQGNPRRLPLALAFVRHAGRVTLCLHVPDALGALVEGQVYAQYPEASLTPLPADAFEPATGAMTWRRELLLSPDLFPCKRYVQFEDAANRTTADPLTAILSAIGSEPNSPLMTAVEIVIQPARRRVVARRMQVLRRLNAGLFQGHAFAARAYLACALSHRRSVRIVGSLLGRLAKPDGRTTVPLDASGSRTHERENDLQAANDKLGRLLCEARVQLRVSGPRALADQAMRQLDAMAAAFAPFSSPRLCTFRAGRVRRGRSFAARPFLLSTEELATLWHPATATVQPPAMAIVNSREAEPPVELPTPTRCPEAAILGNAVFRGQERLFGILPDDRRRHVYIAGKTGMGKSTLLHRLLTSDIAVGRGVGLLDPHGDLCDAVLAGVPPSRTNDVVLFDAGDKEFPLAFNILSCPQAELRPLVASGVISAFKKVWRDFWGPRMEHILRNALLTLLDVPGTTLLSLQRLLSDKRYRDQILARVTDPAQRAFWQGEFGTWSPKLQAEAVSPILNKVGAFVSNPALRNIVGQERSTLDLRRVMDSGQVLLCNLSKGRIGEDASALLGSFLVTGLQLAAMGRAELPEADRRDFYLYVDEFQNYATESFATILSEARKYRLNLTVANQFLAQVQEDTLSAVWGNVGSMILFQVGVEDAEALAAQLGGAVTPSDLLALPRYHAYVRLLIDGQPSKSFSMRTLAPPERTDQLRAHIIRRTSRHRYGRPILKVEQETDKALAIM